MKNALTKLLCLCLSLFAGTALAKPGNSKEFGEKDWGSINSMVTLDGKAYVATALTIYEIDKSGKAKDLMKGNKDWGRTYQITALDGKLYCINEDTLFEVEKNGKTKQLGKQGEWSGGYMAGLDGKLYIIDSEILYEVDKDTGAYKRLSEDWFNTDGMVALDGKLYILSRDQLHEVDKTGKATPFEGKWSSPTAMTLLDGKIYVASSERTNGGKLINELVISEVNITTGKGGPNVRLTLPKGQDWEGYGVLAMAPLDGKLFLFMPSFASRAYLRSLDVK